MGALPRAPAARATALIIDGHPHPSPPRTWCLGNACRASQAPQALVSLTWCQRKSVFLTPPSCGAPSRGAWLAAREGLGTTAKAPVAQLSSHPPKHQRAPAERRLAVVSHVRPQGPGKDRNRGPCSSSPGPAGGPCSVPLRNTRCHPSLPGPLALGTFTSRVGWIRNGGGGGTWGSSLQVRLRPWDRAVGNHTALSSQDPPPTPSPAFSGQSRRQAHTEPPAPSCGRWDRHSRKLQGPGCASDWQVSSPVLARGPCGRRCQPPAPSSVQAVLGHGGWGGFPRGGR